MSVCRLDGYHTLTRGYRSGSLSGARTTPAISACTVVLHGWILKRACAATTGSKISKNNPNDTASDSLYNSEQLIKPVDSARSSLLVPRAVPKHMRSRGGASQLSAVLLLLYLPLASCLVWSLPLTSSVHSAAGRRSGVPATIMVTSSASTSLSAPPPIPLLPEAFKAASGSGGVGVNKRPKKNPDGVTAGGGPLEMLALHPSVGEYPVDYSMHSENRGRLVARMRQTAGVAPRSVLLFRGGLSAQRDETDHEPVFRQESTFHYLFGVREPDCFATIDLATERTTVYIPRLPADHATWMGKIRPPSDYEVRGGVECGVRKIPPACQQQQQAVAVLVALDLCQWKRHTRTNVKTKKFEFRRYPSL